MEFKTDFPVADWQPYMAKLGSDLDKARQVIESRDIKAVRIESLVGLNRQSISNYRVGRTQLEKAGWVTISKLAHVWDIEYSYNNDEVNATDFVNFLTIFVRTFDKLLDSQKNNADDPEKSSEGDRKMVSVIELLSQMAISDIPMMIELYKKFKEEI